MIKAFWKAAAWGIAIFILSVIPPGDINRNSIFSLIPHLDKIGHAIFYCIFSILLYSGFINYGNTSLGKFHTFAIAVSFGIMMEILQGYYFIVRQMDVMDIIANTAGVLLGIFLYAPVSSFLKRIRVYV